MQRESLQSKVFSEDEIALLRKRRSRFSDTAAAEAAEEASELAALPVTAPKKPKGARSKGKAASVEISAPSAPKANPVDQIKVFSDALRTDIRPGFYASKSLCLWHANILEVDSSLVKFEVGQQLKAHVSFGRHREYQLDYLPPHKTNDDGTIMALA